MGSATSPAKRSKSNPSPNSTTKSLFFALPRELRDQIFDEVWKDHAGMVVLYNGYPFAVQYDESALSRPFVISTSATTKRQVKKMRKVPASPWIMANQQFMEEAIEQFQRRCTWTSDCTNSEHLNQYAIKMYNRHSHFLLAPWKARALRLESNRLQELYVMDRTGRNLVSRVDVFEGFGDIARLKFLHFILPAKPELRRLEFDFKFFHAADAEIVGRQIEVDLKALRALHVPSLASVVLTVKFPRDRGQHGYINAKMREELSALGLMLIGGEGREEFHATQQKELAWRLDFTRT